MKHSAFRGRSPFRTDLNTKAKGWPGFAVATLAIGAGSAALIAVSEQPEAKSPGATWCYNNICHRVKSIEQTQALVGKTLVIETSFYDDPRFDRMNVGKLTSNGEPFDAESPARASSSDYPDGTELLLRNPENGRTSHVRVNDFGPFYANRLLDVTKRVAQDLGFAKRGVTKLEVTVIAAPTSDHANYRKNRLLPPALGFVGELDAPQVRLLAARLIGDQAVTQTQVAAASPVPPAVQARVPAEPTVAAASVSPTPLPPAPLPAPIVMASAAPATVTPTRTETPLAIVGPTTPHFEAVHVETPALAMPHLAPDVEIPAPAIEQIATPIVVAVADATAQEATGAEILAPAVSAPEHPAETNTVPPPIMVASAITTLPTDLASQPPSRTSADSHPDTPATSLDTLLRQVHVYTEKTSMMAMDLWQSIADALPPIRMTGSSAMMMALVSGLASLLLYSAWMMMGVRPAQRSPAAPAPHGLLGGRHDPATAPASGSEPEPAPTAAARTAMPGATALFAPAAVPDEQPAAAPAPAAPVSGPRTSFIAAGLIIEGTISGTGRLVIAGHVTGQIAAETVEVISGGRFDGQIQGKTVLIGGHFNGQIEATHLGIGPDAQFVGDVVSETLATDPSASIEANFKRHRTGA